jgi:hypothetical protein
MQFGAKFVDPRGVVNVEEYGSKQVGGLAGPILERFFDEF